MSGFAYLSATRPAARPRRSGVRHWASIAALAGLGGAALVGTFRVLPHHPTGAAISLFVGYCLVMAAFLLA